jgi:hypothetical protein
MGSVRRRDDNSRGKVQNVRGDCVKNVLAERDAVSEMKEEDPSEPVSRSRLQTAVSCCCLRAVVVNVHGKGARTSRHVWVGETSASKPLIRPRKTLLASKPEPSPCSGKSMAECLATGHAVPGVEVA